MRNPVFIVGFPRSGTTLLRSIISQHSDIHLVNEPEIIWSLRRAGYDTNAQIKVTKEVIESLRNIGLCKYHLDNLDKDYLNHLIKKDELLSFREVYESLLPKPEKVKIWGEKSLNNVFFIKDLLELYPNALIINIIRDVRSCVWSKYLKSKMKNQRNRVDTQKRHVRFSNIPWISEMILFAKQAAFWSAWYQTSDRILSRHVDPNNLINLRYEDFIDQTKTHLNIICEKLGIPFEEEMLDHDKRQQDPVLLSRLSYAHQNIAKEVDRSRIYSYREMPSSMIWVVERFAKEQMTKCDYAIENPRPPLAGRILLELQLIMKSKEIEVSICDKLRDRGVDPNMIKQVARSLSENRYLRG